MKALFRFLRGKADSVGAVKEIQKLKWILSKQETTFNKVLKLFSYKALMMFLILAELSYGVILDGNN